MLLGFSCLVLAISLVVVVSNLSGSFSANRVLPMYLYPQEADDVFSNKRVI